jgi:uncharacterized membrane protein
VDTLLVITFRDKSAAREAVTALRELNRYAVIRLDRLAVVTKDATGELSAPRLDDDFPPPSRTLAGTALGSLIGLLAGLPGFVVGASLGGLIGLIGDARTTHVDSKVLSDIATALVPGAYGVIAEVREESAKQVDDRMQALGGTIFRVPR